MYIVFYNTNDVFLAEDILISNSIDVEIVPTPVQDKAYCGVCLKIDDKNLKTIRGFLSNLEYIEVENG